MKHKWIGVNLFDDGVTYTICSECDTWIEGAPPECSGIRTHRWKNLTERGPERECTVCGMLESIFKMKGSPPCPGKT